MVVLVPRFGKVERITHPMRCHVAHRRVQMAAFFIFSPLVPETHRQ